MQMLRRLFLPSDESNAARRLYVKTVEQARNQVFYENLKVPDTVTGRFDMISLHGFLVMNRLQAPDAPREFAELYCSMIFNDMDRNLREMGVGDLSVGKKVRKLAEGFYGRSAAYRSALTQEQDAEQLSTVLSRNIYAGAEPSGDVLRLVEDYVRRTAAHLSAQDLAAFQKGEIEFPQILSSESPNV